MAFYTGQKRKYFYKVDLLRNGVICASGVAQFTTKKEAKNFVKKSNKVSKLLNSNRVARYRKLNIYNLK